MIEWFKIVFFSVLAAVVYGVLHDQITAHVSVEYFTIAHPPVFPTESPFWLAIGWGTIATWWVGLLLGLLLAAGSRLGTAPKLSFADVQGAIVRLMFVSGCAAMLAGLGGMALQSAGLITLSGWDTQIIPTRHARFAFALWAHATSYLFGCFGGLFVVRFVWRRRQAASASINSG